MNKSLKAKMQRRINKGVVWMNSRTDEFWDNYAEVEGYNREDILDGRWLDLNLETLDLNDSKFCVLGQTGRAYYAVIRYANLSTEDASQLGFVLDEEDYNLQVPFQEEDYSLLTELWIAKIKQLRLDRLNNNAPLYTGR